MRPTARPLSRLSLLLFLSLSLHACGNVVFEEIGQMAGATSYIHLSVTVGLRDIEEQVLHFAQQITAYEVQINKTYDEAHRQFELDCLDEQLTWKKDDCDRTWQRQMEKDQPRYVRMADTFRGDADRLLEKIRNLRGVLPTPTDADPDPFSTNNFGNTESRTKRSLLQTMMMRQGAKLVKPGISKLGNFIFKTTKNGMLRQTRSPSLIFSLAKGILGTFMGLYTQYQIDKLRSDVDNLRAEHEQLVEVVAENRAAISELSKWVNQLNSTISMLNKINPGIVVAEMNSMYQRIRSALEVAVHTVQQAMHRRLAVDLLSPSDLAKIFEDLEQIAVSKGFDLLTTRPSDLLQIETSYVYDGARFVLLLHVPMTPTDSLLRLLRLRPFPIPFSSTHSLLPRVPSALLALSKGKNRLMTTIEHSDLVGCHQIGHVYTCDRHGALRKDIKSNCLGALFEQDIPEARKLCDLQLVPRQEAVLQLKGNNFLVYSPAMFTARMDCHNGTSSEVYIKREVQKVLIDPGCSLDLKSHQLSSEFSLYLESKVRVITWEKEDISLFGLNEEDVEQTIREAGSREGDLMLSDILKTAKNRSRFPAWKILLGLIIGISVLGLAVLFIFPVGLGLIVRFRTRFSKLKQIITQLVPTLAEQINRILTHLHLPQIPLQRFPFYPQLPAEADFEPPPPPFAHHL